MRAILLSALVLPAYAGTSVEDAAIAEAMAQLESAKVMVEKAASNGEFAATKDSPLLSMPRMRHVMGIAYNSTGKLASVILAISGTGNATIDGRFIGVFGTQTDGGVQWVCGTAASPASKSPAEVKDLYQYLPQECRH
jgi:Pilin (bacterial filament)